MMYEIAVVVSFGRDEKTHWPSVRLGLRLVRPDPIHEEPAPKRPVRVFPTEPPLPSLSGPPNGTTPVPHPTPRAVTDAIEGLVNLGYSRRDAIDATQHVVLREPVATENVLREALKLLAPEGAIP